MAEQPIRVMFRLSGGAPFRLAAAEEQAAARAQLKQAYAKWKAAGVKLVGYVRSYGGGVVGYAHHHILDVPDLTMVHDMNHDILAIGLYEKHSFEIGRASGLADMWEPD